MNVNQIRIIITSLNIMTILKPAFASQLNQTPVSRMQPLAIPMTVSNELYYQHSPEFANVFPFSLVYQPPQPSRRSPEIPRGHQLSVNSGPDMPIPEICCDVRNNPGRWIDAVLAGTA